MLIPSYDDLTPSIPDITFKDAFARIAALAGRGMPPRSGRAAPHDASAAAGGGSLYACLRSTRSPDVLPAIARDFSPRIQRHGPEAVVLDVSGLGGLLGDARAIGAEIDRAAAARARGIRVAVAPTQTAARLFTIARPGLVVTTAGVAASLGDLPLGVLGPFFVDADAPDRQSAALLDTFRRWGLTTLREVAALPAAELSERIGQPGMALQRLARGIDPAPLVPDPGVPRFIGSMEFEWPIETLEPLSFVLARLLDPLAAALERADRGAAAIRLDLRLTDRAVHTRRLQLPAAMRDARVLRTLLLLDLESHPPPAGVDTVTIEADPAPARIIQYSLLEHATPSAETMATLMARLRALVGDGRCGAPARLDTHRPDGFEMRDVDARPLPPHVRGVEGAPAVVAPALRRFRPPVAVRVTVDRGGPAFIAIDRRGMPGGDVAQHAGPWRTSGAWWQADGTPWDRDEWDVLLKGGTLCRIYRDRLSGVWFIDGVFD